MSRSVLRWVQVIFASIVLVHTVLFIFFWLTNSLFYSDTNDYLANMLGSRRDYVSLCLLISASIGLWSAGRIVIYTIRSTHRLATLTTWLYVPIGLVYIAFFYGSFRLLFKESPGQLPRLGQMIFYFRWMPDIFLLLLASFLAGLWSKGYLRRRKVAGKQVSYLPLWLLGLALIVLLVLPLANPPDSVFRGALPAKPLIIAHRGAAMLAPENTLASANLATSLGAYGLETDLHISSDGKLFLMHDDTLKRTTNVEQVYPDRAADGAEYFSLAEVTQLNAGKWFIVRDPYHTIASGLVSDEQLKEYATQTVPTLDDELQIIRKYQLVFIFDLKQPPVDHPYAGHFFDTAFSQIHAAGIDPQIWLIVDKGQLEAVQATAPRMKLVYAVDFQTPVRADELKSSGYQIINADYVLSKDWIRKYQEAGLWVNLYTVDEPWQFSRLWLLGVHSIITTNIQAMGTLDHPILSIAYELYILLWSMAGLLSLGLFFGLAFSDLFKVWIANRPRNR